MLSVCIPRIKCSSFVVSCLLFGTTLPSLSCARHQSPYAFWVNIVLTTRLVRGNGGGICARAIERVSGQVMERVKWDTVWDGMLGDDGGG